jgi:hypothetical protein
MKKVWTYYKLVPCNFLSFDIRVDISWIPTIKEALKTAKKLMRAYNNKYPSDSTAFISVDEHTRSSLAAISYTENGLVQQNLVNKNDLEEKII